MMKPEFQVFGHNESGHSYKVCLFLRLAGHPYAYKAVDVFKPLAERPQEFRTASRFGEVPVLQHNGHRVSQSNAILLYLTSVTGRFGGADMAESVSINEWLFWEMSRLSLGVANLRYSLRFEEHPSAERVALFRERAEAALRQLDQHLQRSRCVVGTHLTIADISCAGYLFWTDQARLDLSHYPNVARWLGDIQSSDGWRPPDELLRAA
jgi:glutathione S-transferase